MLKARHKDLHPLLKIAEWLLVMILCLMAVFAVWRVLPINHASTGALLLFQGLQAFGVFIIPAICMRYLWGIQPAAISHQQSATSNQQSGLLALLGVGIMVTAIPLINSMVAWNESIRLPESLRGLEQWIQQTEAQAELLLQGFLTYKNGAWQVLLLNLLVLAILPGIGEELAFRGVLQSVISGQQSAVSRQHVAIWVTAFVFSFVHFQFYGFIPRLLLGALFGYVLLWSGRLGLCMLMHATNNALSVLVFYLGTYQWHLSQPEIDAIGTQHTWWLTLVCTPVLLLLIYMFRRIAVGSQPSVTGNQ